MMLSMVLQCISIFWWWLLHWVAFLVRTALLIIMLIFMRRLSSRFFSKRSLFSFKNQMYLQFSWAFQCFFLELFFRSWSLTTTLFSDSGCVLYQGASEQSGAGRKKSSRSAKVREYIGVGSIKRNYIIGLQRSRIKIEKGPLIERNYQEWSLFEGLTVRLIGRQVLESFRVELGLLCSLLERQLEQKRVHERERKVVPKFLPSSNPPKSNHPFLASLPISSPEKRQPLSSRPISKTIFQQLLKNVQNRIQNHQMKALRSTKEEERGSREGQSQNGEFSYNEQSS